MQQWLASAHLMHQYQHPFSCLSFPEFASIGRPSSSFTNKVQQCQMTPTSIVAYPSFPSPDPRERHYHAEHDSDAKWTTLPSRKQA
jgi:hypothetical protein